MGRSIQEMYDKFKYLLKDDSIFYGTIMVLIAITSFGLGRWSMALNSDVNQGKTGKSIEVRMPASVSSALEEKTASTTVQTEVTKTSLAPIAPEQVVQMYVGSRSGTKYHLLTCPGAKQIKETNKIFFATKEDAQKAGYTPASNCKGI